MDKERAAPEEKIVMAAHSSHCGGTCLLKVHVREGVITRVETDDGEEPQYRACARGRASRQRIYAPDRLLYPMRRVGARGEGKFERISWDEALDRVAGELKRVKDTYGPASILVKRSGGDVGLLQTGFNHLRMLRMAGGCSEIWGVPSFEGAVFGQIATFGTVYTDNTRDDLRNSRLIILWGWNPADTVTIANTAWHLAQAREAGATIISVDPRFTNTAASCADRWIPIRPGTDAAMLVAMAYVMVKEGLADRRFLDRYTVGFDKYEEYLTGKIDGIPKTPRWAEGITGVPAAVIERLAREYATLRPAALMAGIGPGRTAYGEQYHRAAAVLAAMTGNIGVPGGSAAGSVYMGTTVVPPFMKVGPGLRMPPNPVESQAPPRKNAFPSWGSFTHGRPGLVHQCQIADAILRGKAGGYSADYKLFYVVGANYPNQNLNLNRAVEALKYPGLEFIVVYEQFMTAAARYADIVLPVSNSLERDDITLTPTFYGFMNKAAEPAGESRAHLDICNELARRLGIPEFDPKGEEGVLKGIAAGIPQIKDFAAFKKAGSEKVKQSYIAFRDQIEHPENNPFPTPSGKIEIYCQRMADMGDPLIPPIPEYIEPWESPRDPLAKKYPLQLITTHFWRRAHSQYDNMPWLKEIAPQAVLINPVDAAQRKIKDGDTVKVFNDRGATVLPAKLTERIMPGVVDIPQGAWYSPDENGVDRAGCANVLTRDEGSPGGAYPTNTALVQVRLVPVR